MIKRYTFESDLAERPFKEGETLWSYARRIAKDVYGFQGYAITSIKTYVNILDISTVEAFDTMAGHETVEIEISMKVDSEDPKK